jgi:o-succinylbenzoate synthase
MRIEHLAGRRLRIPLAKPYKLAFGDVTHFDTILVETRIEGRTGLGEATILNGYTDETIEESWALTQGLVRDLPRDVKRAEAALTRHEAKAPFVASAFASAIEMAQRHPVLNYAAPVATPLLFGVNATDPAGIAQEMERAYAAGYRTLKIKAGFDLASDLERVRLIQDLNADRMKLRVDANQGYAPEDGVRFARSLSPRAIELLEQPCHAKDWAAAEAVAKVTRVPLMLDESIYNLADIERAARIGASFVKLKLMKMGSLTKLMDGLQLIRALGMTPVLGNGVASDVGCWMEACVAASLIDNAGEMNGYLRQAASIVTPPIPMQQGSMQIAPGWTPTLDSTRLAAVLVEHCSADAHEEDRVS